VWLSAEARDALEREAARMQPKETGGILAGYRGDQDTIVITNIVGPGPNAVHGLDYFIPDHAFHQAEMTRIYHDSGRISTYLGDWHSHPDGGSGISKTDRSTLRRIASAPAARAAQPLMVVVSGGTPWSITAHRIVRNRWRMRFAQLSLCET
jgi:integrative and conjugative element protein (TIGR02256 family)